MPSFEHLQLAKKLHILNRPPASDTEYSNWVRMIPQLELLAKNAGDDEIILYASSHHTGDIASTIYAHTVLTKATDITPPNHDDLLDWSSSPYEGRCSYSWSFGENEVRLNLSDRHPRPTTMKHAQNLVFGHHIEWLENDEATYYELLQEFAHATQIHWLEEQRAYCQIDENGDIEPVVSITKTGRPGYSTLITCKREPLERYTTVAGCLLVRFFDFTTVNHAKLTFWDGGERTRQIISPELFYDQCIHPDGHSFVRGVQILKSLVPREDLFRPMIYPWYQRKNREYASFLIHDIRNNEITEVSTRPGDTTNYFQTDDNSLPFEMSPAFFRPEVLLKYKTDRDKYRIEEDHRTISCRGTWRLKTYDVNEAGQVHTYIVYLRDLPYQEQLHWKSFNEEPKAKISRRAFENDFEGIPSDEIKPLERILMTLTRWNRRNFDWWRLKDESLLHKVNTPVSNSRDEWALAFQDLTKLLIEGFSVKDIRSLLDQENITYDKREGSLSLVEKLISGPDRSNEERIRILGLREAQLIRTKAQSHQGGSEGDQLARDALREFGSYRNHFNKVCDEIAQELDMIEACVSDAYN